MDFVEQLPGPYWLTYLALFILQSLLVHILAWIDGWQPAYTFNPIALLFPFWLWAPLVMMTYLDQVSMEALSSFSQLLEVDEETLNRLKVEFTVMPARSVILSGVFWVIIYIIFTVVAFRFKSIDWELSSPRLFLSKG
jgi:hypothetical protein